MDDSERYDKFYIKVGDFVKEPGYKPIAKTSNEELLHYSCADGNLLVVVMRLCADIEHLQKQIDDIKTNQTALGRGLANKLDMTRF